ncbi:MAG: hypothetical protein K5761_05275 [Clostridiales bacterium]|nr:hypothetical protein [Clostridiales bacterium]
MKITEILRAVISILLAFLLSISFSLLMFAGVGKLTALSGDYIVNAVIKSGYGEKMQSDLKYHFVSWGAACNIGEDFFEDFFKNVLTPEYIENEAKNFLRDIYTNPKATINTDNLNSVLRTKLKEYAVKKGYGAQKTLDEDLARIADELCNMYKSYIRLPGASTINSMIKRAEKYINYAILGPAVAAIFCMLLLILFYKDKKKSLMYICSGFFASFLMLFACPLYLRSSNLIGKVNIGTKALYSLVVTYVNGIFEALIASSVIALAFAVFFLIIYIVKAKKAE